MLFQNYPIWRKIRDYIYSADPDSVGITIFSQDILKTYYNSSSYRPYDGGVLVSAQYNFIDILPDEVFHGNHNPRSTFSYGDNVLSQRLNGPYRIRQPFQECLASIIARYCSSHGNPSCELNFYTKEQAPYATTYDWNALTLCKYLPPELTFPMSEIQNI